MAHSALTLDTWLTNTMTRPGCVSRNLYSVTSFWPSAHSALYLKRAVTQPCTAGKVKRAAKVRGALEVQGTQTYCDRRSTMTCWLVKSNTSGGAGSFSAAINLSGGKRMKMNQSTG